MTTTLPDTATSPRVLKAGAVNAAPVLSLLGDDMAAQQQREAEAALAAAVAEAYQRGVGDGRAAAESDGVGAMPRVADAIAAATAGATAAAAEQVRSDTDALVATAVEVAAWMVGEQAMIDPSLLIDRIERALDGLAATTSLEIEVAPSQLQIVQQWAGADVEVVANAQLGPADAQIRAGAATADLTVAEAVRRAMAAVSESGR
jgi:flagellar biosynthesis/type III secretory pathway protein FliH